MELWLAVFGLCVAVLMIWLSRNRHRDTTDGTAGVEQDKERGGGNGHGTDGDGSGSDGGGGD